MRTVFSPFPSILPLVIALAASGTSAAAIAAPQGLDRIEKRSYFFEEAKKDMEYALFVPKSYEQDKKAPLIVLLHGLGSNPGQVIRYRGITDEARKRGYIVVAPYGYNSRGWFGSRGKGKSGRFFGGKGDPDNLGELSEKDVMNVLGVVRKQFNVDEDRIYLMGHSMGGAGTVYLGATYPDVWAGLAPMAPALNGSMSILEKMKGIPVMIVTGDKDRLVPVKTVRRWVAAMNKLGMKPRYLEIEGGDHVRAITRNPEMIKSVFDFFDESKRRAAEAARDKGERKRRNGAAPTSEPPPSGGRRGLPLDVPWPRTPCSSRN